MMRRIGVLAIVGSLLCAGAGPLTACASGARGTDSQATLRLGYLPNVTHAPALAGIATDAFADSLPGGADLRTSAFDAGPAVVEALFAQQVDAAFIGANPAINAYVRSHGDAVAIVAGATSGGASLVVRPEVTSPNDLKGMRLATPQIGSTQDIALRSWLRGQGLDSDTHGGGEVSLVPQQNSQTLDAFRQGRIDGAWVPEPWATRLVRQGGGSVLLDEHDIWPGGRWATTLLVVRRAYLRENPDAVKALIRGLVEVIDRLELDPAAARAIVNDQIAAVTGKRIDDEVLDESWRNLEFTVDPIPSSIHTAADNAVATGLLDTADIEGIFELKPLNEVLAEAGHEALEAS